jgi:glutamyl-tRNA synthetase
MRVRTRIAPSPTGEPHVGTLYMALFNMIFAKHHKGDFILRIEDTDQSRSKKSYEESIYSALRWIGLNWDEGPDVGGEFGPYRQSERSAIYKEYCTKLIEAGKAYKCFATADELEEMRAVAKMQGTQMGYDRRYRNLTHEEVKEREDRGLSYVIRLKVPLTGEVSFIDEVKGRITTPCKDIDDQILLKSDGFPTYHLANVVDDHLMQISHIIRGDEWISSTPKHVLLYEAFGFEPPKYLHLPLLLGTDGKKLSKRKNPTSSFYYKDAGYLPEAFENFLTLMGYSMPDDKELYSLEEIIASFDVKRIGLSGAIFDHKKLDWINQQYIINTIKEQDLWPRIEEWGFHKGFMQKVMKLCHTRIKTFADFFELCDFFFINNLTRSSDLLCPKGLTEVSSAYILQTLLILLETNENWDRSLLEAKSQEIAKLFGINHKKIVIPILFATFMGKLQGPPLYDSFELLGKSRARARILSALEYLGQVSTKKIKILNKALEAKDCSSLVEKKI